MSERALKTAIQTLGHTQGLKDGSIAPQSFDFAFEEMPAIIQAFRRMVRGLEFDISEMALTTYLCAKAHGRPLTALPVFLVRAFHHGAILYNTKLGIRSPQDLEGKRVGVNRGYTVTTGVWARSVLQYEYGVNLGKITWMLSGDEHVAEYRPPSNVIALGGGKTLDEMLKAGDIAAAIGVAVDHPDVAPLVPHAEETAFRALRTRGYYPINHTLVVKDTLLNANPELAADIFRSFAEAKRRYVEQLRRGISKPTKADQFYRRVMDATGADPLPYGIAPNRHMVEALIQHAGEQGIVSRPFTVEQLFASSTLDLTD